MPESLPSYSFDVAFTRWHFDLAMAVFVAVLAALYVGGIVGARRRGTRWPVARTAAFGVFGLGGIVLCTMSSLAVYQHAEMWAPAAQLTLLLALVPVGIGLGDPIGLLRAAVAAEWLEKVLSGRVVRALTFPVAAAIAGVVIQIWVFFGPVLGWALRSAWAMDLTYVAMLAVGCLLALPLLGTELLPEWCTEPLRLLFAFFDGLIDAVPGILVMTTSSVLAGGFYGSQAKTHVAGALMLALSEVVAIPLLLILFFRWAAREGGTARSTRFVNAEELRQVREPDVQKPWWETEDFRRRTDEFKPR